MRRLGCDVGQESAREEGAELHRSANSLGCGAQQRWVRINTIERLQCDEAAPAHAGPATLDLRVGGDSERAVIVFCDLGALIDREWPVGHHEPALPQLAHRFHLVSADSRRFPHPCNKWRCNAMTANGPGRVKTKSDLV